jgi:heparan-alpha-glucosaminide N-acetyltransferase
MFIVSLSITEEVFGQVHFDDLKKLQMDEAYLTIDNVNNPNTNILLGNPLSCQGCDLEKMAEISSNSNVTLIINTQYAYDFQVRSLSTSGLLLCQLTSYKFIEHGTYLLKAENDTESCSIVQIGGSSHYWLPIIIGILVWILFIVIIEFCCYIYRSGYLPRNVSNQRLIKDNNETIPLMRRSASSEEHSSSDDPMKSKRFQALDSFRGLAIMVMIFVNYGGMFILLFFSLENCISVYRWWLSVFSSCK